MPTLATLAKDPSPGHGSLPPGRPVEGRELVEGARSSPAPGSELNGSGWGAFPSAQAERTAPTFAGDASDVRWGGSLGGPRNLSASVARHEPPSPRRTSKGRHVHGSRRGRSDDRPAAAQRVLQGPGPGMRPERRSDRRAAPVGDVGSRAPGRLPDRRRQGVLREPGHGRGAGLRPGGDGVPLDRPAPLRPRGARGAPGGDDPEVPEGGAARGDRPPAPDAAPGRARDARAHPRHHPRPDARRPRGPSIPTASRTPSTTS